MENNKEEKPETISEAMGFGDTWAAENMKNVEKAINETESISEAMMLSIKDLKVKEFGDVDLDNISMYEKKLIYIGYQMSGALANERLRAVQGLIESEFLKTLLGGSKKDTDD